MGVCSCGEGIHELLYGRGYRQTDARDFLIVLSLSTRMLCQSNKAAAYVSELRHAIPGLTPVFGTRLLPSGENAPYKDPSNFFD